VEELYDRKGRLQKQEVGERIANVTRIGNG